MSDLTPAAASEVLQRARCGARAYLAVLLAGVLAIGLGLGLFGWRLGPPEGDLARISGASERALGWRGEAIGFAENHYDRVALPRLLSGAPPGDILVFGDSFSIEHAGGVSWINTLHARTGLSVRFVRIKDFKGPLRYLSSKAFARTPPRAVIVQTVERALLKRASALRGPQDGCGPPGAPARLEAGAPLDPPRTAFRRRTTFDGLDELMAWGALAARLRLTGGDEPVLEVGLSRDDLFTHAASDRLLLLGADVANHVPEALGPAGPETSAEAMRCGLRRLANAAGDVPFRLVVAPDKRTAYAPWIADSLPEKSLDLFAQAEAALGSRFVNLREPLRQAIEAGVKDIYWPDDSHWGAAGNRLAGEQAAAALLREAN